MPITVANVEAMLQIVADQTEMTLEDILRTIHSKDASLLPKPLAAMVSDPEVKVKAKPEAKVWARKATEEFARDLGLTAEDILERTGKDNTIVLVDVKKAHRDRKINAQKKKDSKKAKEPEPESGEEDDGEVFIEEN